ncbi:MAG: hypothetical protein AAGA56_13335 [Myxococcota bacterium]
MLTSAHLRLWLSMGLALVALLSASPAAASEDGPLEPENEGVEELPVRDGPTSLLVAHAGMLGLPIAESCPFEGAPCEPGELAIDLGVGALGRIGDFAFGGGVSVGFGLRTTEAAGEPVFERQQRRSYFTFEGLFRYYLPPVRTFEWWVGASAGVVVVDDRWTALADRQPIVDADLVGPDALSISTEGGLVGLALGGTWMFSEIFFIGTELKYSNWVLPRRRQVSPLGDLASLAGRIDVVALHIVTGFELPI